jgi:undecaprenyl-phosphate galactose phosphotransferase
MANVRSVIRSIILVFVDILSIYFANYVSILFRRFLGNINVLVFPDNFPYLIGPFWPSWIWIIFISLMAFYKLYTSTYTFWEEFRRIISVGFLSFLLVMAISYISGWYGFDTRFFLALTSLAFIPIAITLRGIAKVLLYKSDLLSYRAILVVDSRELGELVMKALRSNKFLLIHVKSIVFLKNFNNDEIERIVSRIGKLKSVDVVIIALERANEEFLSKVVSKLHSVVRKTYFIPNIGELPLLNSEMLFVMSHDIPFISIRNNLLLPVNRFIKRSFDIVFSLFALILSFPILLILSVLIVLESPGWPIYKARRVGKGGKEFYCYKLRSMYKDADERLKEILERDPAKREEWEKYRKLKDDPRITKIGKIIRKLSLDEFPQFFNVLKGEMSIVGPRAVTKEEIEKYYREEGKYYYYLVTPGITGLWQVLGRNEKDYDFRVKTDIWYVENWSFWLDIVIILKTIPAVIKSEGAY